MIGKTLSVLSYSCFIVAYRPSQSILKFRAKFQIANGFHTEQREPTINLRDFVTSVNTLKSSAAKQVVDDKLSMNFYSAAQLVGAVVGYEGSNIFPSVLLDKIKWQPPVQMLETVKSIVTGKSKQDIGR